MTNGKPRHDKRRNAKPINAYRRPQQSLSRDYPSPPRANRLVLDARTWHSNIRLVEAEL
ncbi:hypothetical protein PC9H_005831, partial [Pleurotus ostreatus]